MCFRDVRTLACRLAHLPACLLLFATGLAGDHTHSVSFADPVRMADKDVGIDNTRQRIARHMFQSNRRLRIEQLESRLLLSANQPEVNQPPTVDAGPDQTALVADVVDLDGTVSDDGLPIGTTVDLAALAFQLDQDHDFQFTGADFEGWGGLGEKWLNSSNGWHFITPQGMLFRWDGEGDLEASELIAELDPSFHADLSKIHDPVNATSLESMAADLDLSLGLEATGTFFENWGGHNEKWLLGRHDTWYFIKPDGTFYRWDGESNLATSELIATLDGSYHADPHKLSDALESLSIDALAATLDQALGLYAPENLYEDWGGMSERWVQGEDRIWYFITPDGAFYRWGHTRDLSKREMLSQLDETFYDDPSKLFDALDPSIFADVGSNLVTMWTTISGPGTATFGDASHVDTTVVFSEPGTYELGLEAHDGQLSTLDVTTVTVSPLATVPPPESPDSLAAPRSSAPLILDGKLSEPVWAKAQSVVFNDASRSDNQITVKAAWDHERLYFAYQVNDAQLETAGNFLFLDDGAEIFIDAGAERGKSTDSNDFHLIVNVQGAANHADIMSSVQKGTNGYVIEIGIPWESLKTSPVAGKMMGLLLANNDRDQGNSVQFDHMGLIDTGNYSRPNLWSELTLTAADTDSNTAPTVNAGADGSVLVSQELKLDGTVHDDGLPDGVTTMWSKVSGPGVATFGDPSEVDTVVNFSQAGTYVLRLEASDGEFTSIDEVTVAVAGSTIDELKAFPGAEGFGASSVGGRGGRVIEVTNLNDRGPGSFRAAIDAQGPRIVVFRVAGTIELDSALHIRNPFLTIAGQTAPGGGITLKNGASRESPVQVWTNDVIIRYLRVRPGPGGSPDAIELLRGARSVMIDHVSASWSVDEVVSTWFDANNITIQWSIISEGLYKSTHHDGGPHSMGVLFGHAGSHNMSLHHNLLAHNDERNPRVFSDGPVDVVNNVIYNPGSSSWGPSHVSKVSGQAPKVNYVGNYVKAGVNTGGGTHDYFVSGGGRIYVHGNITPLRPNDNMSQTTGVVHPSSLGSIVSKRNDAPQVTTTSAEVAFDQVLADAGANIGLDSLGRAFARSDSVDIRVVRDVRNGTGSRINDPSEVGGWPQHAAGVVPTDSDHDGMPDDWEAKYGFDANHAADGSADADGDGYTNVEEYLNQTIPRS